MNAQSNGMVVEPKGVGPLLRRWREARHLSQLELSLEAEVSARHISFLETGRAAPSREMLLTLANVLDVPLRERNVLLLAAGYAPVYGETSLAMVRTKSGGNCTVSLEFVVTGLIFYPSRVES